MESSAPVPTVEQVSHARRLALAFQSVFGQQARRSSDQRLVLEHIRKCSGHDGPIFQTDKEGRFDPIRAAHLDGARTQFLIIERQLEIARRPTDSKPKPVARK
jgi:hypothetical protein